MAIDAATAQARNRWLIDNNTRLLVVGSSALCVTTTLKYGDVVYLELLYVIELAILLAWYVPRLTPLRLYRPFAIIGVRWAIFSFFALLLASLSLNQNFYLEHVGALKQPFVVTVARIGELFLDVFFMLYLANRYRQDRQLCRLAAWSYYLVGVAGAIFSIISVLGLRGAYEPRMRGFTNEGGPYGLYVITLIFLTVVMQNEGWISRRVAILSQVLFFINVLGSQSKAALFEAFALALLAPALRLRGKRLIVTTLASVLAVCAAWVVLDIPSRILPYTRAINEYRRVSAFRPHDGNLVAGRAAGLFLAPTMIKTHPFIGIGLGNYPIVRDDPQYRRGTPIVGLSLDAPSLGPIDYIVDLGFPLFFFFTWTEIAPGLSMVRRGEKTALVCLVLMQPVANWFGAHLNLTYPWVCASIGLGIAYSRVQPASGVNAHGTTNLMDAQAAHQISR